MNPHPINNDLGLGAKEVNNFIIVTSIKLLSLAIVANSAEPIHVIHIPLNIPGFDHEKIQDLP